MQLEIYSELFRKKSALILGVLQPLLLSELRVGKLSLRVLSNGISNEPEGFVTVQTG